MPDSSKLPRIDGDPIPPRDPGARPPVQKWGILVAHRSTLRRIPVEIDSEELMQAIRLFQPYGEGPARLSLEEQEITWRDRKGLHFGVTTGAGVTEIRVYVSKLTLRRRRLQRWVRAAADRLEDLIRLVAARSRRPTRAGPERLPPTEPGGS